MDFCRIKTQSLKKGITEVYPDFVVCRSKDLMIRGKSFYAIWDEERKIWSTDEYDVIRLVDRELAKVGEEVSSTTTDSVIVRYMENFKNRSWKQFREYISSLSDNYYQLDERLCFQNEMPTRKDYISKKLPYSLEKGEPNGYSELVGQLYDGENRRKLEWAIGSIVSGDSRKIQKFIVLYGEAGTGKSTMLNIIQQLFYGYYTTFEAKSLTSSSNAFSTEVFKSNPLVAIQHDGDLSRIEDNTKLNSIVSHEEMTMNEKYKASYTSRANCFLFMGTNKPVKITDAKSGIIRRLIDVRPTGNKIPAERYHQLMHQIEFELGQIAQHCLDVYKELGPHYYDSYRPVEMILQTDVFYNFVEGYFDVFKEQDGVSLTQAYDMYKQYCEETLVEYKMPRYRFREELRNYFKSFEEVKQIDGKRMRSYYSGFKSDIFTTTSRLEERGPINLLEMVYTTSILDKELADCPAQYANEKEIPIKKWSEVRGVLASIETVHLHYVKPPENHIVIDFDLKDEKGEKSLERNIEAASEWPPTYAEISKGGNGIHLHYNYTNEVRNLSHTYGDGIEIKTFTGNSSLRRKLTKCNNLPIATISSGLPLKEEKMVNFTAIKSEKGIREQIERNLRKEIHGATKPSIDMIKKILDDAYNGGVKYDVSDMRQKILNFAMGSTHQATNCIKIVSQMKFFSDDPAKQEVDYDDRGLVFFDVEVFPNLFLVCWKFEGTDSPIVRMVNPSPVEMEKFLRLRLVGFNCRRYDNHICYARYLGWGCGELFDLSQRIINNSKNAMFSNAYNLSYTDVYDFASAGNKKSLKKFEIELGIHHQELGLPFDEPVDESLWDKVAEYCENDVRATEATFNHLKGDWAARQILAELSGLTVNDTTNSHSTKIIFGDNKHPQSEFVYTDLSEMFPGYKFEAGRSTYRGEETGEGGYVYAEPGIYTNVALLDVASMHPSSIENLNLFGRYTKVFSDIKQSRVAIKRSDRDALRKLMDGRLLPFYDKAMDGEFSLKDLSNALKTVINSVYGLTSARFDNPFRDPRNKDNIVAKRGALFMIDLKYAVQEKGFQVAHIKTDSIKIPNATPEIIQFVMDFGKKYGYEFEHEATYERMCLVNDAVYIARYETGEWTATGAQFAQPYVFKSLFSGEPIEFKDMCETRSVTTSMCLDMDEGLPEGDHNYVFVGKTGLFCPMKPGKGGGVLLREKGGKYYAVGGTKGYRWMEAEMVEELGKQDDIDTSYYINLVDAAVDDIGKFGDAEWFIHGVGDISWDDKTSYCSNCERNGTASCQECWRVGGE